MLDDPLWAAVTERGVFKQQVLIPLLLDDPLWEVMKRSDYVIIVGLNPSFAG